MQGSATLMQKVGRVHRRALIASYSNPNEENRVKSQLNALTTAGWEVDTLGFGYERLSNVCQHFSISDHKGLRKYQAIRFLVHILCRNQLIFNFLVNYRIAQNGINYTKYDLIVIHDLQILPLVNQVCKNGSTARVINVDVHEMHEYSVTSPNSLLIRLASRRLRAYHKWLLNHIDHSVIDLITTVGNEIANHYKKLSSSTVRVIRNCPLYVDQLVGEVDELEIKLIHHGKAARNRNLEILIDACRLLKPEFMLTFMLTGEQAYIDEIKSRCKEMPNINFIDPVEMNLVSRAISAFDMEVIFFPPVTRNLEYTFPNKFFEAIQGRLGVIAGPSIELERAIRELRNGVVASGWTASDLAESINKLSRNMVSMYKKNSDTAANELNSEKEWGAYPLMIETEISKKSKQVLSY